MLLRRVISHVRNQEWTAIAIDFLIVVLGVFVATQVANWNAALIERELERAYLLRLHEEVSIMITQQETERAETVARAKRLEEVAAYFEAFGTPDAATPEPVSEHCSGVISSHLFAGDITLPPTISELISTGQILLVSNQALRMRIVRFAQAIDEYGQLRHDIQVDRMVLSRKYPDLIRLSPVDRAQSVCDFPAMAQSQAFRNDLLDNERRFKAYAAGVIQGQQGLRQGLHDALDIELEITHVETAP
ncbi:hypothetical protein [Hyphomonas sp.]|uniref:hypothetical protein n=1 Tax=Hyphomonas sp. TaxID=87 RepID=UPI0025C05850|nr:hypothetical protein [Hyphomonas sp.]